MSGADTHSATNNPTAIRSLAAQWLRRQHDSDCWTGDDQVALDAWLAQSTANEVAYLRLGAIWSRANRLAALRRQPITPKITPQGKLRPFFRVAPVLAIIAISGIVGAYFLRSSSNDVIAIQTGIGGHKVISLVDGSRIELNTNTAVRVAVNAAGRNVWLDKGEAYFEVQHDSSRPFRVISQNHRITDLGTKFSVRGDEGRLEIVLLEGRAEVDAAGKKEQAQILTPGDVAIATQRSIVVTHKADRQLKNALAWRKGLLIFSYATLDAVTNEFNRYNEQKIVLLDPSIARLSVVGTFRANDSKAFIELAREVLHVHAEQRGETIVLSR